MRWKLAARCRGEEGEADAEEVVQREGAHATATVPGAGKMGPDGFRPAKLFSIDRVFRNETMDATHLAEFHQVEGVVADRGLTLADLIGRFLSSSLSCRGDPNLSPSQGLCVSSSGRWVSRTSASSQRTTHTRRSVSQCSSRGHVPTVANNYPQPSLEIFAFHPQLKKWVEVGNSGMFRPEMLEPMGFPKDVHVHGWGISLERPTMIRYVSGLASFV